MPESQDRRNRRSILVLILLLFIGVGMFWEHVSSQGPDRGLNAVLFGRLPKPTEPKLMDPLKSIVMPQQFTPMRITHIPRITMGTKMPHPYVGACINCHLIRGGAAEGSQFKTPYGVVVEKFSKEVVKLGPPITPESNRPHPPAGRCIKCHDIVVNVPNKKSDFVWDVVQ